MPRSKPTRSTDNSNPNKRTRSAGVNALIALFGIGTCASLVSVIALTFPGSFLEPIWRLNPRARAGFSYLGNWSILLMLLVCAGCSLTAIGLWRGRRWGYTLAALMIVINLVGDVVNLLAGETRAIAGIPIALLLLLYLPRQMRNINVD